MCLKGHIEFLVDIILCLVCFKIHRLVDAKYATESVKSLEVKHLNHSHTVGRNLITIDDACFTSFLNPSPLPSISVLSTNELFT